MKSSQRVFLIGVVPCTSFTPLHAADTLVAVTAEARGLVLVSPDQLPAMGTFWLVLPGPGSPVPLPCPPFDSSLPVYAIAPNQFLVDSSAGTPASALERQT